MTPKTATEITAKDTDHAEDTDEDDLRWQAARGIAGTDSVRRVHRYSTALLIRVFRVIRVVRGKSCRRFQSASAEPVKVVAALAPEFPFSAMLAFVKGLMRTSE